MRKVEQWGRQVGVVGRAARVSVSRRGRRWGSRTVGCNIGGCSAERMLGTQNVEGEGRGRWMVLWRGGGGRGEERVGEVGGIWMEGGVTRLWVLLV